MRILCCSIVFRLDRFKPCCDSGNDNRQHHSTHTTAPLANNGCHSTQATQHETGYQRIEHVTVFMGRRNDDSQEHAVERHTQGCHHRLGQQTASHDANSTSRCPKQRRYQGCRVCVSRRRVARMGNRDAKHLVGHATGHQYAVKPRCTRGNLLRECRTHQHIAQVGYQAHSYHLHVGCLHCYQRVCAIFASRCTGEEAAQESQWCRQACPRSNDAKRERHGKIPHRNGNAVTQAVDDMLSIPCHRSYIESDILRQSVSKNKIVSSGTNP